MRGGVREEQVLRKEEEVSRGVIQACQVTLIGCVTQLISLPSQSHTRKWRLCIISHSFC